MKKVLPQRKIVKLIYAALITAAGVSVALNAAESARSLLNRLLQSGEHGEAVGDVRLVLECSYGVRATANRDGGVRFLRLQ